MRLTNRRKLECVQRGIEREIMRSLYQLQQSSPSALPPKNGLSVHPKHCSMTTLTKLGSVTTTIYTIKNFQVGSKKGMRHDNRKFSKMMIKQNKFINSRIWREQGKVRRRKSLLMKMPVRMTLRKSRKQRIISRQATLARFSSRKPWEPSTS